MYTFIHIMLSQSLVSIISINASNPVNGEPVRIVPKLTKDMSKLA